MDPPENPDYTVVYSEKELYAQENANVYCRGDKREVVNCKENLCFNKIDCFKQHEASDKISNYTTQVSMNPAHKALPIKLESLGVQNDFPSSASGTVKAFGKETVKTSQDEQYNSSIQIIGPNRVTVQDNLSHSYVLPDEAFYKCEEQIVELRDFSDHVKFSKEGIVSGNTKKCLDFQEPGEAILKKAFQNVGPCPKHLLDKYERPIDQDCSSSDVCEDETFLSIESGSYSRSSSPFSLDDPTDTESCIFEEALEDLSSNFLYNKNNLHRLFTPTDNNQWPAVAIPGVEATSLTKAASLKLNSAGMTTKHRNMSCNTDLSWQINYSSDKETQTKVDRQEMGVNTDIILTAAFTQGVVKEESGDCKGQRWFSTSHEALRQRIVKAELQLLDVQRFMCWQLCWKTQQQSMETQSLVSMHTTPAGHSQAVGTFNLLSALTEVEEKYLEMKMQIQSGVPLDSLIPLNMQLTKVKTPPDNLMNQCFTETCHLGIQKGSADHPENLQKNEPVGSNHASTCLSSTTEGLQKVGREHYPAEQLSPEQKRYYVHVGNISPFVTEVDLKTALERFEVSNIFLEASSLTSSYAVLIFTCSEKAQAAVKEMDGKVFSGKKLKVRVVKNSIQNFQFASQQIKNVSTILPEAKTKHGTADSKSFNFQTQPENMNTFSKPIPQCEIQRKSNWENVENVSSNMQCRDARASSSIPIYDTSTVCGFVPPLQQWTWHSVHPSRVPYNSIPHPVYVQYPYPGYTFPVASPFSFQTTVKTPVCKPSVKLNCNVPSFYSKIKEPGVPSRTGTDSVHDNTMSLSSSKSAFDRYTSAETTLARVTAAQPVKESASLITKPSENRDATSGPPTTTATSAVLTTLTATAACKMPELSESFQLYQNKTLDTPGKTNFKPAAPLRFPMFVPDSVTIPETNKTCYSTIDNNTKDCWSQPTNTVLQKSLPLNMEWGVHPKLDLTSEHPVFIVPNRLNPSQFTKVMDYLLEHNKNVTRNDIVDALEEIRTDRGGSLGALTMPQILKQASSKLAAKNKPPE